MGLAHCLGNDFPAYPNIGFGMDLSRCRERDIGAEDLIPCMADHDCLANVICVWDF